MRSLRAFTLIELLIVIGIIAILAIVVVLVLNPAQILMQTRDGNRISDLATLTTALGVYSAQGGSSFGTANVIYVSIPDPTATSTAGDQCQGLGLPALPATYTYFCAASSTYRKPDGTGWIPINFTTLAGGSPLGQFPVDPINTSSSRDYFTYTTNGSQYEVTSVMESNKYKPGGSNDIITGDGGTLASLYEKGTKLGLEPMDYGDSSMVGLWTFNEGTGTIAYDYSGSNATGSWNGTQAGTNGYYSAGKVGSYAGAFDGSTDNVSPGKNNLPSGSNPVSVFAWIYSTAQSGQQAIFGYGTSVAGEKVGLELNGSALRVDVWAGGSFQNFTVPTSSWHFVGFVYSGGTTMTGYLDTQSATITSFGPLNIVFPGSDPVDIGKRSNGDASYFAGLIDEVRIYNRALSAAEIAAMYNGGK